MRERVEAGVPFASGSLLLGSARDLQRDQLGTYERAMRTHGDLVRFRVGPPRLGFEFDAIFDPEGARHVLSGSSGGYVKDAPAFTEVRRVFGDGLLTSEGERWRRHRRMLQPLFTKRRVAAYVPLMSGRAQRLAEALRSETVQQGDADLHGEAMSYALDVLGGALFGEDLASAGPVITSAVPLLNQHAARRGLAPVRVPAAWPTPANRAAARARHELRALVDRLVADRQGRSQQGDDLLGRLVEASDPETGTGLNADAVRDEALVFLVAGHETVANALAFTLHLVARHEAVQDRVRREVDHVVAGRPPSADDLEALTYTGQVVDEALRLYPSGHTVPRRATTDDTLRGHPIPAGRIVAVSLWGIHRNPKVWTDPRAFRPERFAPPATAEIDRYAYLPFGAGPRACIGVHFARAELVAAVATMVRSHRLIAAGPEPRVTAGVTIGPHGRLGCAVEPLSA